MPTSKQNIARISEIIGSFDDPAQKALAMELIDLAVEESALAVVDALTKNPPAADFGRSVKATVAALDALATAIQEIKQ